MLTSDLPLFQPPSQTPTYRSFQFADSLEGTKASLQRHSRKNSSVPDYVPSNFNSRVQTQSSAVLTDEINEPRRVGQAFQLSRQRRNRSK